MLERFFLRDHARCRIRANSIGGEIEQLLQYLVERGHSRQTIHLYVQAAEHFGTWLASLSKREQRVDLVRVAKFLNSHLPVCCCPPPCPTHISSVRAALRHLLRAIGAFSGDTSRCHTAVDQLLSDYATHLEANCGLAVTFRHSRMRYAREFLESHSSGGNLKLEDLTPDDAIQFVSDYAVRCKRTTAKVAATALRGLLRFLHFRGLCEARLVQAVPSIQTWKLSTLPRTLNEEQLQRFLDSFNRSTPTGRRDYAIAVSMVYLGLRVGEVCDLTLHSVDWRNGVLRLAAAKGRRTRELPLTRAVGSALAAYVKDGRPLSACNGLFLRHSVPKGTCVSRQLVRGAIRRAYQRAGFPSNWTGTHLLRHTAATSLFVRGAPLKEIADLLGHRSIDTSMIYTKVNLPALRSVALPWPEEVQS